MSRRVWKPQHVWKQNDLLYCDCSMFCCDCRSKPRWKARLRGWINNARNQGEMKRWEPQLRDRQKKRERRGGGKNNTWSGRKNETPERTNKWLCKGCRDIMDFTHRRTYTHTHTRRNMIISRVSIRKRQGRNCFLWPACYRPALGLPGFSAPLLPSDKLSLSGLFSIRAKAREKGRLSEVLSAWLCWSNPPHLFYLAD